MEERAEEQGSSGVAPRARRRGWTREEALGELRALTPRRQDAVVLTLAMLVTLLLTGLFLREAWYRVQITRLGYEMTELTWERQRLMDERKKLQVEGTYQLRTERLEQVSRQGLGLKPLHQEQIIRVGGVRHAGR